jgi:hypothetical protein
LNVTAFVKVLPNVVVPVGAAVELEVGATAAATVTVLSEAAERLPAVSTTYNL